MIACLRAACLLIGSLLLCCPARADDSKAANSSCETVSLSVRQAPPLSWIAGDQQVHGLAIELLRHLARHAGLSLQLQFMPEADRPLDQVRMGMVDIIPLITPSRETNGVVGLSRPWLYSPAVLLTPDARQEASLRGYAGRAVGVVQGDEVETFVRHYYPLVHWITTSSQAESLRLMQQGQLAGMVGDRLTLNWLINHQHVNAHIGNPIGYSYAYSFAWSKDRADIGLKLNQALLALPETEQREIFAHWLGTNVQNNAQINSLWMWGSVLLMVSGLLFLLIDGLTSRRRSMTWPSLFQIGYGLRNSKGKR